MPASGAAAVCWVLSGEVIWVPELGLVLCWMLRRNPTSAVRTGTTIRRRLLLRGG